MHLFKLVPESAFDGLVAPVLCVLFQSGWRNVAPVRWTAMLSDGTRLPLLERTRLVLRLKLWIESRADGRFAVDTLSPALFAYLLEQGGEGLFPVPWRYQESQASPRTEALLFGPRRTAARAPYVFELLPVATAGARLALCFAGGWRDVDADPLAEAFCDDQSPLPSTAADSLALSFRLWLAEACTRLSCETGAGIDPDRLSPSLLYALLERSAPCMGFAEGGLLSGRSGLVQAARMMEACARAPESCGWIWKLARGRVPGA